MNIIKMFKVLSNPLRQNILMALKENDQSKLELARTFEQSESSIQKQLDILEKSNCIFRISQNGDTIYKINKPFLMEVIDFTERLKRKEKDV